MKTGLFLTSLFLLFIIACGKDKFETVPQLKFKSRSTDIVEINGDLKLTIEFTDKEGDVDDSLILVRQRLNKKSPLMLAPSPYPIPKFTATSKGEFVVTLTYQYGLILGITPIHISGSVPSRNEPDTLSLKFVARDKAGNKSDTLTVNNVYVIR